MDAVKKISVDFFEKKCAFSENKMLSGTIFAERERERLATDTPCVAFWCVRTSEKSLPHYCFHTMLWFFYFQFLSKIIPKKGGRIETKKQIKGGKPSKSVFVY